MAWVSLFVDILTDRSGRLSAACSVVCLAPPRFGVELAIASLGFGLAMAMALSHFRLIGIGLLDAPPFVGEGG